MKGLTKVDERVDRLVGRFVVLLVHEPAKLVAPFGDRDRVGWCARVECVNT